MRAHEKALLIELKVSEASLALALVVINKRIMSTTPTRSTSINETSTNEVLIVLFMRSTITMVASTNVSIEAVHRGDDNLTTLTLGITFDCTLRKCHLQQMIDLTPLSIQVTEGQGSIIVLR